MQRPDKQHGCIWDSYTEVSAEALRLTNVVDRLGLEVVFRPWNDGWVIFNLRGLYAAEEYVREEAAKDAADEEEEMCNDAMRDTSRDNYTEEAYTRRDLAAEVEEYRRYVSSYD